MTAVLLVAALLIGFALGAQLPRRRRFNAGVEAGRRSERLAHNWRDDPNLLVPPRRRWSRVNRKSPEPEPAPPLRPGFYDQSSH